MQINKFSLRCCLFGLLFFISINQTLAQGISSETINSVKVFDVTTDSNFFPYHKLLVDFLKFQRVHKINNICILGEEFTDRTKSAWIIWYEGKKLILWDGHNEPLSVSRRILDLDHDVVPDIPDINGSNYLVTRAWVEQLKKRCEAQGTKIKITKSELKPIKEK